MTTAAAAPPRELDDALRQIDSAITAHRYHYTAEAALHDAVEQVLVAAGVAVRREVRLSGADRVDLLAGRIAIEVKVGGPTAAVRRQLQRYLRSRDVDAVVLVTCRARHRQLNGMLVSGKPVLVVDVSGGAL